MPTAGTAVAAASAGAVSKPARGLQSAAQVTAAQPCAVALTGLSLRLAGINSLAELYCHMRDGTELHTVAPFNR